MFSRAAGKKAIGIDGIDKASYEENLDKNLQGLMEKMKRMAYTTRGSATCSDADVSRQRPLLATQLPKIQQRHEKKSTPQGHHALSPNHRCGATVYRFAVGLTVAGLSRDRRLLLQ